MTVLKQPVDEVVVVGPEPPPAQPAECADFPTTGGLNWCGLAKCESGLNPNAYNPAGPYYGLYQFDQGTWNSNGGTGTPSGKSIAEQTRVAYNLYQARGRAPWPSLRPQPLTRGRVYRAAVTAGLLGPAEVRALAAAELGVGPTKTLGQNFVHDPNTVRRIVRTAPARPGRRRAGGRPRARLAHPGPARRRRARHRGRGRPGAGRRAAATVAARSPDRAGRPHRAHRGRAAAGPCRTRSRPRWSPTCPYNVAVPVLLHLLELLPTLRHGLVMVQAEVAERLAAPPGSRTYGVPSVKAAWYADVRRAGAVPRAVFWPVPNVDSGLVALTRRDPPPVPAGVGRRDVFAVVDAAFAQRRKTLRAALAGWAGLGRPARRRCCGPPASTRGLRGEALDVGAFARVAARRRRAR